MRKVFLDDLPKWEDGMWKGKTNWKESIGCTARFIYNDIEGVIEIVDFNPETRELIIKYNDKIFWDRPLRATSLVNGSLGYYLKIRTTDFKYELGERFENEKRDLIITDRRYIDNPYNEGKYLKQYKYTCNKCGWTEGWIVESDLIKGRGCSCCHGKTVVKEINDLATTSPWVVRYLIDKEQVYKYTKSNDKKVYVQCPDCGKIKSIRVCDMVRRKSIGCICSDSFSYPEKIVHSILNQLSIRFEMQLSKATFGWCGKYRYDFYLPEYNCIIEVHGIQHYEQTGRKGARTLEEEQENDRIKKELALTNGIKHYIELDCRYSDLDYIRNSILNSKLNELFNLTNVSWFEAEEFAINSNKVKEVCDYWNSKEEWETVNTIANNNEWGIKARSTIQKYLKKGTKLGWCKYDPKEELRKGSLKGWVSRCNIYEAYDLSNNFVASSHSAMDLAKKIENILNITNVSSGAIIEVCKGRRKTHKGLRYTCNKK